MIRQEARDHADRLVTHSHQGALPGSFARGLVLAPLRIGGARWIVRNEPQSVVVEPMSEGATPHVGELRALAETGAACAAPDVETGQFDELFAMGVLVDSANGGQHRCGGGFADARHLPPPLAVPTRLP